MKTSKVLKRNSHELPPLPPQNHNQKQALWGKRSLIFTHTNTELFQGLLELTKLQAKQLNESFEEDQVERINATATQDRKNVDQTNPFIQAKVQVMLKKNSAEVTSTRSSNKEQESCPLGDLLRLTLKGSQQERETVTWKQINYEQGLKKRHALKCLTDRNNRK